MATIEEDYVSFDTAKLLKEKGFDARCPMIYTADGELLYTDVKHHNMYAVTNKQLEYYTDIIAPTQAMAMKWLREVYNLCLFVIPATIDETFRTGYALYPQCDSKWEWCASKNDRSKATFGFNINKKYCDSYEQACEAAIKYCVENLI